MVFLVRHAEKVDDSRDPELSAPGKARANALARLLRDSGIQYVHSTDYRRTRSTAAPTAGVLGLNLQLYDPRKLPDLAAHLRASGGRHLVVGHSNTTAALVELLGEESVPAIDEATEYDRLYIVSSGAGAAPKTLLLRY